MNQSQNLNYKQLKFDKNYVPSNIVKGQGHPYGFVSGSY